MEHTARTFIVGVVLRFDNRDDDNIANETIRTANAFGTMHRSYNIRRGEASDDGDGAQQCTGVVTNLGT